MKAQKRVLKKRDKQSVHSHLSVAIGGMVREERIGLTLTQTELGEKLGMSAQFLGRVEKGLEPLSEEVLVQCISMFKWDRTRVFRVFRDAAGRHALELCIKAGSV